MGLQKFQKNILKATHNLEFLAVLVFPDSSITLDTRMSNLDIRMSKLDIRVSRLDIRVSVPTILVLQNVAYYPFNSNHFFNLQMCLVCLCSHNVSKPTGYSMTQHRKITEALLWLTDFTFSKVQLPVLI